MVQHPCIENELAKTELFPSHESLEPLLFQDSSDNGFWSTYLCTGLELSVVLDASGI